MTILAMLAQVDEGGPHLPGGPGELVVWLVFGAVIAGLGWVVHRSRLRAQDEYYARKRREQEERLRRLGQD
jgi:hypothetical protein